MFSLIHHLGGHTLHTAPTVEAARAWCESTGFAVSTDPGVTRHFLAAGLVYVRRVGVDPAQPAGF
jgi:hypothetical protein